MNRKGFVPAGSPGEKQCRLFNYVSWVGAFCALLSLQFLSSAGVFLTDGFLFEPSELHAAQVKSVQRGSVSFTSGANRMAVTLSPAVDPTKTIVWGGISHGGGRSSGANANDTRIGFDLESSTTLALERLGSPSSTPFVEWQAVDFESGVSVQRGLRSLTTSQTTVNVPLPTAVDITKSFVLVSVAPNSSSQTTDERWTIRSRLTTSNNLELSRNESGTAVDIYWQVIQMEGAAVQRGLLTLASGVSTDFAIIPSVNTANSFLIMSYRGAAAVNGIESQYLARGVILDGDENIDIILFNRESFTNSVDIAWEVVSMSDGTVVQSNILGTNGPNDTILDQSISAVNLTRAFVYISVQGGSGTQTANLDEGSWTATLTSSTNLRFQRSSSGTSGTINWQVIQFAGIPPTKLAITSVNSGLSPQAGVGFPVVVQAQDSSGIARNVTSATNVSLSLKTGTGTLGGTLTGAIPAGSSQVTINGVTYTKAESGVSLTATRTSGDSLSPGDSAPFTVNPGTATTLAFTTEPANTIAGGILAGPPVVAVQDSFGNTVTSSTASITIAIGTNPGGGTLSGTTIKNASGGVATFSDLSINQAATGYTLAASAAGLSGATSSTFNINAGAAAKVAFTTQPGNTTAGSIIPGPPTVTVQDNLGNTVTSSTASITVAIGTNPSGGTLSGTTTLSASSGVAAFTDLSVNQIGAGYTLTASSTGLTGATSSAFDIAATAGLGAILGIVTRVRDGNPIGGALVEALQSGVLKGSASTAANGSYSITELAAGTYDVRASARGFLGVTRTEITVTNGSTTTVDFSLQNDKVWEDSNSASYLSLLAPGASICSSVPTGTGTSCNSVSDFDIDSGTSMAAPHVAGAWAILKQKKPDATVGQILNALQTTGIKIEDTRTGFPRRVNCRIQIDEALNNIPEKLTTLNVPDSVAYGINNCGQIVGTEYVAWTGFISDTKGTYTSIVYNGPIEPGGFYDLTESTAINNRGQVVGSYCCGFYGDQGFQREPDGSIVEVNDPDTNAIYGNNDAGDIVGSYWTGIPGDSQNFKRVNGITTQLTGVAPLDINNVQRIVGLGGPGGNSGVLIEENGGQTIQTVFTYPDATFTFPSGINESGQIVGQYWDSGGNRHGFLRQPDSTFTQIDYPGAAHTVLAGINDSGQIVGYYWDAGGSVHGFIDLSW